MSLALRTRASMRRRSPVAMLLAAVVLVAPPAFAQSAIREVPRPATPYVPLYSTCRAVPPDHPTAIAIFKAEWPRDDTITRREIRALLARPVDTLSAVEAEAFFVALADLGSSVERLPVGDEPPLATVAREHGQRISARFPDDTFVQCARIGSEVAVTDGLRLAGRFTDADRAAAREQRIAFVERLLRGGAPATAAPGALSSSLGHALLDRGFGRLRAGDAAAAANEFEIGARHLLDAGATRLDSRNIAEWRRYAFALNKLPEEQRLPIAQRLVSHAEQGWKRNAQSEAALEVYLHVLGVAGNATFAAGQGKEAVSLYQRQLEVAQGLRKAQPTDPNHEVMEAIAHLQLGDAHRLARNARLAWFAYEDARKSYERTGQNARDMLDAQDFTQELASRRDALR